MEDKLSSLKPPTKITLFREEVAVRAVAAWIESDRVRRKHLNELMDVMFGRHILEVLQYSASRFCFDVCCFVYRLSSWYCSDNDEVVTSS